MRPRLKIIVTGMVGQVPLGGVAWDYWQYPIGLSRLGHDVVYHEDTRNWPYNPEANATTSDPSYSVAFIEKFFGQYAPELANRWHYRHLDQASFGMSYEEFQSHARAADIYLNVSGTCQSCPFLPDHCRRVFLDTDPGYNQIVLFEQKQVSGQMHEWSRSVLEDYDQYFTYAENIHGADCLVPQVDLDWKVTRMPIVLDLWPAERYSGDGIDSPWTTILTWNNFRQRLVFDGVEYRSKDSEFEKIIELPRKLAGHFRVALGGKTAPKERLAGCGWDVVDGPAATLTPASYQEFLGRSRGEFSVAKNVYVAMHSGWFSCRSACYLALAKPVVVQDTGFSRIISCGEGILPFSTIDEAIAAIEQVQQNPQLHARAARQAAETYFDSEIVLEDFIGQIMGA